MLHLSGKTLFFGFLLFIAFSCRGEMVLSAPTVQEILSAFQEMDRLLFGDEIPFHIDYSRNKCEEVTKSRYSGGYLNVRFALARKEKQWYSLKQFLVVGERNNLGENIITLENGQKINSPLEPTIIVTRGNTHLDWKQDGRPLIVIQPLPDDGHNVFQNLDYFRHIGLNPAKHIAHTMGADIKRLSNVEWLKDDLDHPYLPDFLEQNWSKYKVLPDQENVDGFPCWILEYPGMDKMWVDEKCGFAVRKRIYHWGHGQPRKFGIHNLDLKEVKPGLWLPENQVVEKYASIKSEDKKIWDQVASRLYYQLDRIDFGEQVPDSLFSINPTPGTDVVDEIRGIEYTVTEEGTDPFAGPIALGIKANRYVMFRAICIITGSILMLFAVWRMLRNKEDK